MSNTAVHILHFFDLAGLWKVHLIHSLYLRGVEGFLAAPFLVTIYFRIYGERQDAQNEVKG